MGSNRQGSDLGWRSAEERMGAGKAAVGSAGGDAVRSGRHELADFDLRAVVSRLLRVSQKPIRDRGVNVILAAVGADLCGNSPEHNGQTIALKRHRGSSGPSLSLFADNALHSTFLLKLGSHCTGSGSYAVTTISIQSSLSSATTTWSGLLLIQPSRSLLGYGLSSG